MYEDEDYLALSGIQHFAFCRRQWGLIHIKRVWKENLLTTQGELMHARAHDEDLREHRGDVIIVRGLTVRSSTLGVLGKCDVVEFHKSENGHPLAGEDGLWLALPVEYKHGRSKLEDSDRLQLCAQAICLEEMLGSSIEYGCLYYGSTHSRERVNLDKRLRTKTEELFLEMHRLYSQRYVPKVRQSSSCRSCSLFELCIPKASFKSVEDYINQAFCEIEGGP